MATTKPTVNKAPTKPAASKAEAQKQTVGKAAAPAKFGFLDPHTYKTFYAYHKALIIYDITFHFTKRFLNRGDRTIDQMVQAARSGKQNIIEGTKASATSKEMEIKLLNVARASFEELLEDFHDFLRVRGFRLWNKNSKEAMAVRKFPHGIDESYKIYEYIWQVKPPEAVANVAITLINQANYLLDRHVRKLEKDFLTSGGIRERMTSARIQYRRNTQEVS